jgi:hypothetical protein
MSDGTIFKRDFKQHGGLLFIPMKGLYISQGNRIWAIYPYQERELGGGGGGGGGGRPPPPPPPPPEK